MIFFFLFKVRIALTYDCVPETSKECVGTGIAAPTSTVVITEAAYSTSVYVHVYLMTPESKCVNGTCDVGITLTGGIPSAAGDTCANAESLPMGETYNVDFTGLTGDLTESLPAKKTQKKTKTRSGDQQR